MSRFASNPKWLIYLPPTMSPCETSRRDGLLEHPEDAFAYYLHEGVHKVVCEQKHMGSRAVVVICLKTDWVCLDCELMPWSAKAQELLRQQYAPTGAAARAALPAAIAALRAAAGNPEIGALAERFQQREEAAHLYVEAYRRYCWPVHSLADLKLAPFHVLASESGVHTANDHV